MISGPTEAKAWRPIVAVSSPAGRSRRGLVRVSGAGSQQVLRAILEVDPPLPPSPHTPQHTHSRAEPGGHGGKDVAEKLQLPAGRVMRGRLRGLNLPVLVGWWEGPRSFTGEDVAEIQLPGHPALLERVVHQALAGGARLAEAGEFTFRAFTAGKLDLTQAEGVAATIAATSDAQLRAAGMLREGQLGRFAAEQVDELGTALALVEAGIDFVDQEDVVPIARGELARRLKRIGSAIEALLKRSRGWQSVEALPRVVLVGEASAGKSTLFNALLGKQRAVVDAQPGTTRDVLTEPMRLRDDSGRVVEVMLVDIAGLDKAEAALDEQVQAAARAAIAQADVAVVVRASAKSGGTACEAALPSTLLPQLDGAERIDVWTKADLGQPAGEGILVSAKTGAGLEDLRRVIVAAAGRRGAGVMSEMLALQPRHEAGLRSAFARIREAAALVDAEVETEVKDGGNEGDGEGGGKGGGGGALVRAEVIAQAMRGALDELGGLGGQMTADDVIGRVFATFCVGK